MNGFSYLPTTNSYLPANIVNNDLMTSAKYVPRQPHVIHQGKDDIPCGGFQGGVTDVLNNGAMYDNWNTVWTPKNRGGIEVQAAKPTGFISGGLYDNTPKENTMPFQSTFRKTYYNPVL